MSVVVTTLDLAAIYALVAIGISLTWAGLGFLNLAAGMVFAVAGYGAWFTAEHVSSNPLAVLLAGMVAGAAAGLLIYFLVFLPLDGKPNAEMRTLIGTLALSFLGTNVLQTIFGPESKALPAIFGHGKFAVGGTVVTADKSGAIITATILLALVVVGLLRSRIGLGVRILTQNPEAAALVGIDRRRLALAILAVSGAMTGLASVLLAQVFYVSPEAGYTPLIKGLIVALLGGLGSVPGTILAALLVAATEALTSTYAGGQYVLMTLFLLIAIVLLVRPRGLGGLLEAVRA
ncbi:MAG TPA: branched-chain amino acid ABC transporter permease [Candidatus Dormibacteraeota bacterium]|nr:branched-chain amino acid ABC transporter permease [Candidatus Dormibacteraeota bacterium]